MGFAKYNITMKYLFQCSNQVGSILKIQNFMRGKTFFLPGKLKWQIILKNGRIKMPLPTKNDNGKLISYQVKQFENIINILHFRLRKQSLLPLGGKQAIKG
jgi:hypothetical protein